MVGGELGLKSGKAAVARDKTVTKGTMASNVSPEGPQGQTAWVREVLTECVLLTWALPLHCPIVSSLGGDRVQPRDGRVQR